MTIKSYWSGLIWLGTLIGLPLILLAALSLSSKTDSSAMASGVFAYTWMLAALFLSGKPQLLDRKTAGLAQGSLIVAALPLSFSHASLNPATGWTSLTGGLALVSLVAVALYSLGFALLNRLTSLRLPAGLVTWANRLNALATALTFAHVQLIADIRSNLLFMAAFYLVTAVAFISYFGKKASAETQTTAGQTETI